MSNSDFIDGMYQIDTEASPHVPLYNYIENNSLQDPFFTQVLNPLIFKKRKDHNREVGLSVIPDGEKKGEKWARVEAKLEPLNRLGLLIFNVEQKKIHT